MTHANDIVRLALTCILLITMIDGMRAAEDDDSPLNRKISLARQTGTVYRLLKEVSDRSGFMFIYDSKVINNDRRVSIPQGEYTLGEAIRLITRKPELQIDVLGNHVLLRKSETPKPPAAAFVRADSAEAKPLIISGSLYDLETKEPLVYASVNVINTTIGTVSNGNGEFRLVIPDSLRHSVVRFSHIGYRSRETASMLLADSPANFPLEPEAIALNEVEVRRVNPISELNGMLQRREKNYPLAPVYLTTFYREGIEYNKKTIDLSEAVLRIYKNGYLLNSGSDQVKLIRKRHVVNSQPGDTILPKMKSGIRSCLILDIMKELPDFVNMDEAQLYSYAHEDIDVVDDRLVNVISFKQKRHIEEPLYTGQLFIEDESKALEEVRFEVNPDYVDKATNLYVDRKAHNLSMTLERAAYIVSYQPLISPSTYCISHIRGDIVFKVRKKGRILNRPLHFWFEMVTCKVDTLNVVPIPPDERLSTNKIFADTKHPYDRNFWENFNIILPEEKLKHTIINSISEVIMQEN